jgi:hypothetical protein
MTMTDDQRATIDAIASDLMVVALGRPSSANCGRSALRSKVAGSTATVGQERPGQHCREVLTRNSSACERGAPEVCRASCRRQSLHCKTPMLITT